MNEKLYRSLAWSNIKKNYRFFIPRILAEAGLLGCFYIALTLAMDDRLAHVKGGAYIPTFMWMGVAVLAILSTVLMLYTDTFLMRQRRSEFGLYNVLGMEKKHVGKVLFYESFISGFAAVLLGLALGVLFYKICSLLICRLLKASIIVGFYFITPATLLPAGLFFVALDVVTYIINRIGIARMKPVELFRSKAAGEKEPKVKWLMLILGLASLGGGYYISLTTQEPLSVLLLFFLAVILVIIGTYFLFVTGSTFVLKLMKKNSRYYYKKEHMPAVSGLLYRMKQNAVGLASIAILATGVLVMLSTTVSLYSGIEGTLNKNYPQHLYMNAEYDDRSGARKYVSCEALEEIIRKAAEDNGVAIQSVAKNPYLNVTYWVKDNTFYTLNEIEGGPSLGEAALGIASVTYITEDTYAALTGGHIALQNNEIAFCRIASAAERSRDLTGILTIHDTQYTIRETLYSFPLNEQMQYTIRETLYSFPLNEQIVISGCDKYGIVVANDSVLNAICKAQCAAYGDNASDMTYQIVVNFADIDAACEAGDALWNEAHDDVYAYIKAQNDSGSYMFNFNFSSYWQAREAIIGMYGTLLFLGLLLGAVCLFATVLIMYYKQISEGYEDRSRFQIMEKIGMSKAEIRKTINSQILFVFFLPLAAAGIHIAFAYPMLLKMMKILMIYKEDLFLICTLITFALFAVVYTLIYKGTSRTYYRIVQ